MNLANVKPSKSLNNELENISNSNIWNSSIRKVLANLSGDKLTKKFSCPLYIFNLDVLSQTYLNLRSILDNNGLKNLKIHYAVKANHNLAVLNTLGHLGCGADVVSIGEYNRARTANINNDLIIFSGVGKTINELRLAIENNIGRINIESKEEWHDILNLNFDGLPELSIRFNTDVDANTHPYLTTAKKDSKFGMSKDDIINLFSNNTKNIKLISGLAVHIGSQITDISVYEKAFNIINQFLAELKQKFNWTPKHLDLGGGFAVAYSSVSNTLNLHEYAKLVAKSFTNKNIHLAIEPGRFLIAESGILLSKVIRIKQSYQINYAIIDAGMNNFIRHALYKESHPVLMENNIEDIDYIKNSNFNVVGPICESADVFIKDCYLPNLKVGDFVIIGKTGAYGSVMASMYNSKSFIPEIVIKNNKAYLSVPELSSAELLERERTQFLNILKLIN